MKLNFGLIRVAAGVLIGLITMTAVGGAALASGSVTIMTPPAGTDQLTIDGVKVGTYAVYDGQAQLTFSWTPYWPAYWPSYPNPAPANHSYKVAVWQNTTPLAAAPTWSELHTSHHWIDDPNPTRFTFDTFLDFEAMCQTCPSIIVVQAETVQRTVDANGDTQIDYVPAKSTSSAGVPPLMKSDPFLIEGYTRLQDTKTRCPLPPKYKWLCLF